MADKNTLSNNVTNLCNVLRDAGVNYGDYLEQITYLIFLKMADEYTKPPYNKNLGLPEDCSWDKLSGLSGTDLEEKYSTILSTLGKHQGIIGEIFSGSVNKISQPALLARTIKMIGAENWSSMSADVKGDIYEDLLKRYSEDTKSGAGQYFTPRPLINTMVKCIKPEPGKTIVDPACGTGGFLLSAHAYVSNPNNYTLNVEQKKFLKEKTFYGWEIVQSTYRLCLMNLFLHNIGDVYDSKVPITRNDALLQKPAESFDYCLANPPFGTKSSIKVSNEDDTDDTEDMTYNRQDFWTTTSNKQLNFVQHIRSLLKTTGKAAVVVPDNVLFEDGAGEIVRQKLLNMTDLHTILRLPTGIFYKPGVKANVIFFDNKPASDKPQTKEVWIYDFRSNSHFTLKKNPLKESDLDDFVKCYNPNNRFDRHETYNKETNPNGRWRKFTYNEIMARDKTSLDISWIKTDDNDEDLTLSELLEKIKEKSNNIAAAVEQLEKIMGDIEE
jgi:type I restriction enzyme M protein